MKYTYKKGQHFEKAMLKSQLYLNIMMIVLQMKVYLNYY